MKLGQLLAQLDRIEMHQAIYNDLVDHLEKVLEDEDLAIPVATGDGVVPMKYVEEVIEALKQRSSELGDALAEAEEAEVGDVELDLGGLGTTDGA